MQVPEGVMELVDGLYLVTGYPCDPRPIPDYSGACVYLIRGRGGECVLVDSGFRRYTDAVVALMEPLGVTPADIRLVAYTHGHGDHAESCEFFQQHGATAAIHETNRKADYWGRATVPADRFFREGDVLEAAGVRLEAYHTPGHTPDSSSFLLEISGQRVLFTGDMTGWFFPARGSDYEQMVASVEKVRRLGAGLVCGGHSLCGGDVEDYWERMSESLGEGIFQMVDHYKAADLCAQSAREFQARQRARNAS
ncbi:MAG: MBL fold metallo-hydrolase [Candidatus Brocadiaceae bacterium]|nr:MBL fold metallo-hydrolase [Candidatus Brocadiaceae bacterium]